MSDHRCPLALRLWATLDDNARLHRMTRAKVVAVTEQLERADAKARGRAIPAAVFDQRALGLRLL